MEPKMCTLKLFLFSTHSPQIVYIQKNEVYSTYNFKETIHVTNAWNAMQYHWSQCFYYNISLYFIIKVNMGSRLKFRSQNLTQLVNGNLRINQSPRVECIYKGKK